MEWLKELLKDHIAEDKMDAVIESYNKEFPKHAVPKSEFNTVKEELKIAKSTAEQTALTLESLKTKADSVEDYEAKMKELNEQMETVKAESQKQISNVTKRVKYEKMLTDNKMNEAAASLVVDKINFDEVILDQAGNIVDAEKHIAKNKEIYGPLFLETTTDSENKGENKDSKPPVKPMNDMTMEEYAKSIELKGITR